MWAEDFKSSMRPFSTPFFLFETAYYSKLDFHLISVPIPRRTCPVVLRAAGGAWPDMPTTHLCFAQYAVGDCDRTSVRRLVR